MGARKTATTDPAAPKKPRARKAKAVVAPRGLDASEMAGDPPAPMVALMAAVKADGATPLAPYREALGGTWLLLAALPIAQVAPTDFQRDLSEAHAKRLTDVIGRLGRYLDPIIAVRAGPGRYLTPNGNHRLGAMRALGAKAITALLVPEVEVAYQILALNVEKAHNLREKSLEVIRMVRELVVKDGDRKESGFALEFEEPSFLTLGLCYEKNGRFGGGGYHSPLKRGEVFLDQPLAKALVVREKRAAALLALDEKVAALAAALKARGLQSPYLKNFVIARCNPLRFKYGATMDPDDLIAAMTANAAKFDTAKIKPQELAGAGGPPDEPA